MLAPWKKRYDKPTQHIKKQRHHFANKGLSNLWFFQSSCMGVRVGLIKAECQRIDAFEVWCWRRLLRVPWIARRSNQSIINEISPEYSLEGLMLKLPYFGHLMWRPTHWKRPWCWAKLKAGGEGDNRGWDRWMALLTHWTWVWTGSGSCW